MEERIAEVASNHLSDAHIKRLLQDHSTFDVRNIRLVCYSGAGFTSELQTMATSGEVQLIDLERLYFGS
ncbi:MAG: hypothetical protein ACREN8_00035 [Candidatus Dormibacteraceae bacterium]